MWADATTHLGKGAMLVIKVRRVGEASLLDQPHGRRDVVIRGAGDRARRWIRTMNAARCLYHRSFGTEINDHIAEVADPFDRWTQV